MCNKSLPTFLVVGAARAGTTSLYRYLAQHPDVYMSPTKEINFFSQKFIPTQHIEEMSIKDYNKYFQGATNEKEIGESSPSYLWVPEAAKDVFKLLPRAKIIIILRNPVDRIISDYNFSRLFGYNRDELKDLIEKFGDVEDSSWHSPHVMIQKGMYSEQVKQYLTLFNQEQVRIFLYDELYQKPEGLMIKIYNFLDINNRFLPNLSKKYNKSGEPFFLNLPNLIQEPSICKYFFKQIIPARRRQAVRDKIIRLNIVKSRKVIPLSTIEYLKRLYNRDIQNLELVINKELKSWMK